MADRKKLLTGIAIGAGSILALLALVGLLTVYTGAYNVAATEDHTAFGRWAFATTMRNSVERRAAGIAAPDLTAEMARAGASNYKVMCQQCHAGPGVSRAAWAQGMLPMPPHMTEAASEWKPNEIFWLVKHGVKMSGMPAFGETHKDRTLWNIVAFVKALPAMSPEQYAAIGTAPANSAGSGDAGAARHGPPGHHK